MKKYQNDENHPTKITSCLLLPMLFRKSVGETLNKICIKKALGKSLVILKLKRF